MEMPRYVRGEGNPKASLMVVGEAPGYYEDQAGRPFVGPSGELLDEFLEECGSSRSEVYVTNVCKFRPPDNKFERLRELGIVVSRDCLPELYNEIREVNPNCILALGNNALRYLTGRHGKNNAITENRGSILRVLAEAGTDSKVVPTFHPAKLLHEKGQQAGYDPKAEMWIKHDIKRAVEESRSRRYDIPARALQIARNSLDVWRFLERNKARKRVSLDIEVIYSIPICIGVAFSASEALSIPLLDFDSAFHKGRLCTTSRDVAESLHMLARVLENPDLEVVGQNFKFDHSKLRGCLHLKILGKIIDIMLVHHTLYPEFPKSLEFMTSIHTREPFYKIDGYEFDFRRDKLEDYLVYNARDAAVQYEISEILVPDLTEFGVHDFYFGFPESDWRHPFAVCDLHHLYMDMETVGFLYDKEKNKELKTKYKERIKKVQERLDALAGAHVNVNSNNKGGQVDYLLYTHWGLPRRAGVSEDVLVALMNSPAVKNEAHKQGISDILELRRLRKNVSTYLNAGLDFDGRMRTSYKIGGAETGRTSTELQRPPVRPYPMGLAFQTMTKHGEIGPDLRKQFPVDKGYVYLQADAKQAEARVVFLLARLYDRLREMDNPLYDIHSITSSWFYSGETPEEIRKQKDKRFTGKTIRHAGHLRMGPKRCMFTFNNDSKKFGIKDSVTGETPQISEYRAKIMLEGFHANDPAISQIFWAEVDEYVKTHRVLVSPHGRRREFFGNIEDQHTLNEGLSFIPQSSIADNTKRAMLAIRKVVPEIRLVLEWHDGFLALVPEREVDAYARLFVSEMEKPIDFSLCSLPRGQLIIPCELEWSDTTYYDLKGYEIEAA